jgi:hypothetical protein
VSVLTPQAERHRRTVMDPELSSVDERRCTRSRQPVARSLDALLRRKAGPRFRKHPGGLGCFRNDQRSTEIPASALALASIGSRFALSTRATKGRLDAGETESLVNVRPVNRLGVASILPLFLLASRAPPASSQTIARDVKAQLDLPYNAAGEAGDDDEETPEVFSYYGGTYEASAVVFALDRSSSMNSESRWKVQKRESARAISELSHAAEFSLLYYSDSLTVFRPETVRAHSTNKLAGVSFVNSVRPHGRTCLGTGLVEALSMLQRSNRKHRAVILTSDGRPSTCDGWKTDPDEFIQRTLLANPGRRIKVHTVFVGTDPEGMVLMKRLAEAHGGSFRRVN